jgi:ATP-dependent Clp protease ATP-binding subunit ClpX
MMMAKDEKLDLALPIAIAILGLGENLCPKTGVGSRPAPRQPGGQPAEPVSDEAVDVLLEKISKNPEACKLLGFRRGLTRSSARIRIKVIAILGWRCLRQGEPRMEIADLAALVADTRLPPVESLLQSRHEIGKLVVDDIILGSWDNEVALQKCRLPSRTLEFLAGGKTSLGFLTVAKLVGLPIQNDTNTVPSKPILTAQQLCAGIKERVVGLDSQAAVMASRLVMHTTRAKLIRAGENPQTPNECLLIIGQPGVGKTHICEVAGDLSGVVFATADGSELTSEGYTGLAFSECIKSLIQAAGGDLEKARFGFLAIDEFTKKARSMGESPVTTVGVQQEALRIITGQELQMGGRRTWDKPLGVVNTFGTCFALLGHCPGLDQMVEKRMGNRHLGFSNDSDRRSRAWIGDALVDFGLIEELVSRLTAIIIIPPPSLKTLMRAVSAENGIVASYNHILGEHGARLFLSPVAIQTLSEYGMENGGYFRAMKRVVSALAGEALFSEQKGTIMVEAADIQRAITIGDGGAVNLLAMLGKPARGMTATTMDESNAENEASSFAG